MRKKKQIHLIPNCEAEQCITRNKLKKRYPNEKIRTNTHRQIGMNTHSRVRKCQVLRMRVLLHQKLNKDILKWQKIIFSSSGKY